MKISEEQQQPQQLTHQSQTSMQRHSPRLENPAGGAVTAGCRPRSALNHHNHHQENGNNNREENGSSSGESRIPSSLSVTSVDLTVACRQAAGRPQVAPSPSHSVLTLTPGRTRNIDQDMEALRLSRQDNPYLQVLASKESLIDATEESESDDVILMSTEFGDTDPLTLAQVHEHLVRSPPPASWSRGPIFHFPHQAQDSPESKSESAGSYFRSSSPKWMLHRSADEQQQHKSDGSVDIRDRHSHTFSRLHPTPIRSLAEVRRLHRSADDSVQLMSSE